MIDVLAALHQIDPDAVGLGDLGRKEAYLQRQMKRWVTQWGATKTHEVPAMDDSTRLLAERMPEQVGSVIVHGDYRLGNMITNDGRVSAVLDWELCTLGDPLADVGYLLNSWVGPGEREEDLTPTSAGGFCSRETLSERYAQGTGRDLSDINYYRAFSHWRLAAINQGVYKRYLVGAMGEGHDVDLDAQKLKSNNSSNSTSSKHMRAASKEEPCLRGTPKCRGVACPEGEGRAVGWSGMRRDDEADIVAEGNGVGPTVGTKVGAGEGVVWRRGSKIWFFKVRNYVARRYKPHFFQRYYRGGVINSSPESFALNCTMSKLNFMLFVFFPVHI